MGRRVWVRAWIDSTMVEAPPILKKKKPIFLMVLCSLVGIFAICALVFVLSYQTPEGQVRELVAQANAEIEAGNFSQADNLLDAALEIEDASNHGDVPVIRELLHRKKKEAERQRLLAEEQQAQEAERQRDLAEEQQAQEAERQRVLAEEQRIQDAERERVLAKEQRERDLQNPKSLPDLLDEVLPSVVAIEDERGRGSGFVVARDLICTNAHVIEDASEITVKFNDGTITSVVGTLYLDRESDIAILQVPTVPEAIKPLRVFDALPRRGEKVVAIGHPQGATNTATNGIVSSVRTASEVEEIMPAFKGDLSGIWIQTTAAINKGNSGGPLIDARGEVVGMSTLRNALKRDSQGGVRDTVVDMYFSISSKNIKFAIDTARPSQNNATDDHGELEQFSGDYFEPEFARTVIQRAAKRKAELPKKILPPASGFWQPMGQQGEHFQHYHNAHDSGEAVRPGFVTGSQPPHDIKEFFRRLISSKFNCIRPASALQQEINKLTERKSEAESFLEDRQGEISKAKSILNKLEEFKAEENSRLSDLRKQSDTVNPPEPPLYKELERRTQGLRGPIEPLPLPSTGNDALDTLMLGAIIQGNEELLDLLYLKIQYMTRREYSEYKRAQDSRYRQEKKRYDSLLSEISKTEKVILEIDNKARNPTEYITKIKKNMLGIQEHINDYEREINLRENELRPLKKRITQGERAEKALNNLRDVQVEIADLSQIEQWVKSRVDDGILYECFKQHFEPSSLKGLHQGQIVRIKATGQQLDALPEGRIVLINRVRFLFMDKPSEEERAGLSAIDDLYLVYDLKQFVGSKGPIFAYPVVKITDFPASIWRGPLRTVFESVNSAYQAHLSP